MGVQTVVFDMTGFSISNMVSFYPLFAHLPIVLSMQTYSRGILIQQQEYAAAKFLIECAQTAYPEILGAMLIHNAPWGFSGTYLPTYTHPSTRNS